MDLRSNKVFRHLFRLSSISDTLNLDSTADRHPTMEDPPEDLLGAIGHPILGIMEDTSKAHPLRVDFHIRLIRVERLLRKEGLPRPNNLPLDLRLPALRQVRKCFRSDYFYNKF